MEGGAFENEVEQGKGLDSVAGADGGVGVASGTLSFPMVSFVLARDIPKDSRIKKKQGSSDWIIINCELETGLSSNYYIQLNYNYFDCC